MGPDELRKLAIHREGMEEKVNRAWWTVCAVVSHDFRTVPGHPYILRCERCGRLDPIRRPEDSSLSNARAVPSRAPNARRSPRGTL
jgi:hypothetical protein